MDQLRDREIRDPRTNRFDESQRDKTDALLRDLGADDDVIETVIIHVEGDEVQDRITRLRTFAEENPAIVLGALSALLAGGAVAAGRAIVKKNRSTKSRGRKAAAKRSASSSSSKKRGASSKRSSSSKRTLIEPHAGDKRYIRRDARGRIKESVDVGRSLAADRRSHSKKKAKKGEGDRGDR